ncbi:MAG: sugar ABC transporter permease [Treponema sp.]|jgi:multiple sugar transport system permease protein|nr:sugar ABC transporter permease [Treponema sp.]
MHYTDYCDSGIYESALVYENALGETIPIRYVPPLEEFPAPLAGGKAGQTERQAGQARQAGLFFKSAKPYFFIAPAFLFILFWLYRPLAGNFYYAFTQWAMVPGTRPQWVGINNFLRFTGSKDFGIAISNTVFYTLGLLPFSVVIPLFLAAVSNQLPPRVKNIYRIILFVPMIMAPVSAAAIWRWLLHPSNGLVNLILRALNITSSNVAFFSDPAAARIAILVITGWKMTGFGTLIFSAALAGIDSMYYQAASLDGASNRRMFLSITIPLVSPSIMLMVMMSILFASQWTFTYIDILSGGGPFGRSTNIYYEMYKYGFQNLDVGMSSAAANLFLAVFGCIGLLLSQLSKGLSFYDN